MNVVMQVSDHVTLLLEPFESSTDPSLADLDKITTQPQICQCNACTEYFVPKKKEQKTGNNLLCPVCGDADVSEVSASIGEMYTEGMSTRKIGDLIGRDHKFVSDILEKIGIKRRSKKEANAKYARWNTCVICGEKFRPNKDWKDTRRQDRMTCDNPACHSTLLSRIHKGSLASNWKGGRSQAHYQRVARELKEQRCERCGTTDRRLDVHHRDKNKANNTPENLQILCDKCHGLWHYEQGDAKIRGAPGWY
jgi:hypothetical protein